MTMQEFGERYNGDIELPSRDSQKDGLATVGADATSGSLIQQCENASSPRITR
jgi:hypothetical protein